MTLLIQFLSVLALVLFFLAMLKVPEHPRFGYLGGGAFCAWLVYLLTHWKG